MRLRKNGLHVERELGAVALYVAGQRGHARIERIHRGAMLGLERREFRGIFRYGLVLLRRLLQSKRDRDLRCQEIRIGDPMVVLHRDIEVGLGLLARQLHARGLRCNSRFMLAQHGTVRYRDGLKRHHGGKWRVGRSRTQRLRRKPDARCILGHGSARQPHGHTCRRQRGVARSLEGGIQLRERRHARLDQRVGCLRESCGFEPSLQHVLLETRSGAVVTLGHTDDITEDGTASIGNLEGTVEIGHLVVRRLDVPHHGQSRVGEQGVHRVHVERGDLCPEREFPRIRE